MNQTYGQLVQQRLQTGYCPFCDEGIENYIDHNDTAFVIASRAPYQQDHILICPKEHIMSMTELSMQQSQDIRTLIQKRNTLLTSKRKDLVIFIREGNPGGVTGKTVGHLHRHIVPHLMIHCHGNQADSDAREFMSDEQYQQAIINLQGYNE